MKARTRISHNRNKVLRDYVGGSQYEYPHEQAYARLQTAFMFLLTVSLCLAGLAYQHITAPEELISPVPAHAAYFKEIKEVEVHHTFTTEKQQILAYIVEKFGDRADDAIAMINQCENSNLDPEAMNFNVQESGRRSWDVGIFQINVDEHNTTEIEKLKDWKYNIDRAYEKYESKNNTFYHWTCGYVVKDKTYLDYLRSKK